MADPLVIRCGSTCDKICTITDSAGDAYDLSDYAGGITSQIRDKSDTLIATFTVVESSLSEGEIRLQLGTTTTADVDPGYYFFDVLFTPSNPALPVYRTEVSSVQFTRRVTR